MSKQEGMKQVIQLDSDIQIAKPVNNKAYILSVPMGCYISPKSIVESAFGQEYSDGENLNNSEHKQSESTVFESESHKLLTNQHRLSLRESDRLG